MQVPPREIWCKEQTRPICVGHSGNTYAYHVRQASIAAAGDRRNALADYPQCRVSTFRCFKITFVDDIAVQRCCAHLRMANAETNSNALIVTWSERKHAAFTALRSAVHSFL